MPLRFVPVRSDTEPAAGLVAAMIAEVSALYGDITRPGTPTAGPHEMWAPHGTFLVGYDGEAPVTGGGVKRLADGVAEIKRMYVMPHARSQGHASALLEALEAAARSLGYAKVRLDTGPEQPHARALYESRGYREIPMYNGNTLANYFGEKDLT